MDTEEKKLTLGKSQKFEVRKSEVSQKSKNYQKSDCDSICKVYYNK